MNEFIQEIWAAIGPEVTSSVFDRENWLLAALVTAILTSSFMAGRSFLIRWGAKEIAAFVAEQGYRLGDEAKRSHGGKMPKTMARELLANAKEEMAFIKEEVHPALQPLITEKIQEKAIERAVKVRNKRAKFNVNAPGGKGYGK
jgi:hypothetical protein